VTTPSGYVLGRLKLIRTANWLMGSLLVDP
jgi:hypothetical protein